MKKILMLTTYPSPYRVQFYDLLGREAEVTVLFSDRIEKKQHRSKNWYINSQGNYHHIQLCKRLASWKTCDLCADVIDWLKKPFDAIVICGYSSPTAILAIWYLRMKKIPFFIEVDGGLIREDSGFKYRFKRAMVSSAQGWISSGKHTTDYLVHYGARREAVYEYPFSSLRQSDLSDHVPTAAEKQALRKELGMEEESVFLSVGQFIHRKGYDVLLKAAAGLPETVGIYIVGGLPTEEYETMHRELGLTHVHFSGFQKKEELKKYYRAADAFVLPTREDIWGLVVNEAMAFGLPVITTDRCVAGLELVENGVSGYIVPIDDPEVLREKMLLTLHSDTETMGQAALQAVQPYTIENMVKRHMEIFT